MHSHYLAHFIIAHVCVCVCVRCATSICLEKPKLCKIFSTLFSIIPNVKYLFIFALLNHNLKVAKFTHCQNGWICESDEKCTEDRKCGRLECYSSKKPNHVHLDMLNGGVHSFSAIFLLPLSFLMFSFGIFYI